jgi:hypothetical protein
MFGAVVCTGSQVRTQPKCGRLPLRSSVDREALEGGFVRSVVHLKVYPATPFRCETRLHSRVQTSEAM